MSWPVVRQQRTERRYEIASVNIVIVTNQPSRYRRAEHGIVSNWVGKSHRESFIHLHARVSDHLNRQRLASRPIRKGQRSTWKRRTNEIFGFGRIVYDPTNHAENLLTAARTLEQINNQIAQLQNEAQMLINQARNLERLKTARAEIATCAISGAVGTYANIDPRIEEYVAKNLGLAQEPLERQRDVRTFRTVLQPPKIQHDVLEWSDDLELLEVTSPADFTSEALGAAE